MISSKMVTYKRKRNVPIHGSAHGIGSLHSCPKSPTDKLSTVLGNSVESNEQESQKADARPGVKCVSCACDVDGNLLLCHNCSEAHHPQCIDPPLKDIHDREWLCSTCVKQQNSGKSLKQRVLESRILKESKLVNESGLGPLKLSPLKVCRARRPGEVTPEETDGSIHTDGSPANNSDSICMGLSSYMNSVPECKSPLTDESSILQSINIETQKKSNTECLGASNEGDSTFECTSGSSLKASGSDNTDSHLKDNSGSSSSDGHQKNKFSTPVITFSRKNRKKENVNETDVQNQLVKEKEDSLAGQRQDKMKKEDTSSTTTEQNRKEDASSTSIVCNRKEDASSTSTEKNKKDDASSTSTFAGGVLETKMCVEQNQFTQGCLSEEPNFASCLNSHQHLSSQHPKFEPVVEVLPQKCIETSSTDVTGLKVMHEGKQSELPKVGDSNVEQSQIMLGDGVKEKPDDVSRDGNLFAHLGLSVIPDSRGTENTTNEELSRQKPVIDTAAETLQDSNHVTVWCEEVSQRGKLGGSLETADGTKRETLSSQAELICGKTCIYIKEGGRNYCGKDSTRLSMGISSEDPCKQSCIDGESNQMVQLTCTALDATACVDLEGRTFISRPGCRRNQGGKMPVDLSLDARSLGLSLPSGPAIDFFKDSPSMPSLSNRRGTEMSFPNALDNSIYSQRHKQMLESIITRAGALKGSQDCSSTKLKKCIEAWSEEELDLLWVGVRRHGKGNWNAILNDPKLCFLRFRDPADLAERWDLEQSRLQDTSLGRNNGFLCRKGVVGSRHSSYHTQGHLATGSQTLIDETQLSLGDVYAQREVTAPVRFFGPGPLTMMQQNPTNNGSSDWVGSSNSELTHTVLQRIGSKQLQTPSGRQRNRSKPKSKRPRYEQKISLLQQICERPHAELGVRGSINNQRDDSLLRHDIPTGILAKRNRPHWLRELPHELPFRPLESGLLPNAVSAGARTLNLLCQEDQRLIPQSLNDDSMVVPPTDHFAANNYNPNAVSSVARTLNFLYQEDERLIRLSSNHDSMVVTPTDRSTTDNNVIVIDSDDASSEATISDIRD